MNSINYINKIKFKNYNLFYKGNIGYLNMPKVAIVGSRRPSQYTKEITAKLSNMLSKKYVVVSGGAMGVDAIAHTNAKKTIMVSPAGLDIVYPKINQNLIENISQNHLIVSEYKNGYLPKKYSFIQRNRIIVDISDFVIITEADEGSGSMRSFEIAKKLNKKIFVIPHEIGRSSGTNFIAKTSQAEIIWDIEEFVFSMGIEQENACVVDVNDAFREYGERLYEMELEGEVVIKDGKVYFT